MQTVTDRQVQTYIVYEVTGKGWDEETREFIRKLDPEQNK